MKNPKKKSRFFHVVKMGGKKSEKKSRKKSERKNPDLFWDLGIFLDECIL